MRAVKAELEAHGLSFLGVLLFGGWFGVFGGERVMVLRVFLDNQL